MTSHIGMTCVGVTLRLEILVKFCTSIQVELYFFVDLKFLTNCQIPNTS